MKDFYDELQEQVPHAFKRTAESLTATLEGDWQEYFEDMNLIPVNALKKIIRENEIEIKSSEESLNTTYTTLRQVLLGLEGGGDEALNYLEEWYEQSKNSKPARIVLSSMDLSSFKKTTPQRKRANS